jgi:PHD/YefM family antitoxin component YafN of YafNO toxin-antitoxin module
VSKIPKTDHAANISSAKSKHEAAIVALNNIKGQHNQLNEQIRKLVEAKVAYIDVASMVGERAFVIKLKEFLRDQVEETARELQAAREASLHHLRSMAKTK